MADDLIITIGANVKGVVTAIDTTKSLEGRVVKLQKAIDEGRISNGQFDMALQKLAKSSKSYEKSVLDYSKALQVANKAQKEATASEALAKKETQAFAQARKEATAINAQFNAQRKLEVAEAQRAVAEEQRLKSKFIEGYAAMDVYSKELNDLAIARKADIITAEQQAAAITRLNQQMTAGTGVFSGYGANAQAMTKKNNQLGVATQQLGYQVGDFFVQIQSGTNPMVAFGQQATQLVGVLPLVATQLGLTAAAATTLAAVLGIAIPIFTAVGAVLLTMYMNSEDVNKSSEEAVDVFQRLRDATKELYTERMKLIDPAFDENLQGTQEELARLTKAYDDAKIAAQGLALYGGAIANFSLFGIETAEQAADAAVKKAKADLEAYQIGLRLTEIERARVALQQEVARLRTEEAQAYADTVDEANRLKDSIGQAYLDALGLSQVPLETGVNKAAEAARLLAVRLGISLTQAQNIVNLAAAYAPAEGQTRPKKRPWDVKWVEPAGLDDGGGGVGDGSAPSDPLADLMKRIELEKELLGTSEEYQEVMQAIQGSDKKYSEAAIQGAVARLEAINKEKAALEQMRSLQQSAADIIGDGFMSMVDGTKTVKEAFRDMARDIIKQLYEVLVIQRLVNGVKTILGGSGLFADGGAFSAGRQIQAYANGGVVGGPTYFPMSGGKTGLMGEAGPEAILPLKRGKGGKLGVSVEGNSGSVNVVNNINVTGGSDPAAIRAEVAKLMPQITSATKSAVIDARRRGGQMKAAFQ
jgi:hypothetical protein